MATAKKAMTQAAQTAPAYKLVYLDEIVPSQTNPRKDFNAEKLAELADSIAADGVRQPILVRPYRSPEQKKGLSSVREVGPRYEIVYGERRFRASLLAKTGIIPAIIEDLDDEAVDRIQFIENDQREDLSPLERARGYARLIARHHYTPETLATRLSKSKAYIYGLLKLCDLPVLAQNHLQLGTLPPSTAQLIARIPNAKLREQAAKEIIKPQWGDAPMSHRRAQEHIEKNFMRQLKGAEFNPDDATLCPAAGACSTCSKLTGNNRALFPDGRADVCTDPPCFANKQEAQRQRLIVAAKEEGITVLSGTEAKKLFWDHGNLNQEGSRKYLLLSEQCAQDGKRRSYKQLLGDDVEVIIAPSPKGELVRLAPRAAAETLLKEKHQINLSRYVKSESEREKESAQRRRQEARKQTVQRVCEQVEIAARTIGTGMYTGQRLEMKRLLLFGWIDNSHSDGLKHVLHRRGIKFKQGETRSALSSIVKEMEGPDLAGLEGEVRAALELESWTSYYAERKPESPICDLFQIDVLGIERQVKQEMEEKQKAMAKPVAKKVVVSKEARKKLVAQAKARWAKGGK